MSVVLRRLRLGKHALVRSPLRLLSNGPSSSLLHSPPCSVGGYACGEGLDRLVIDIAHESECTYSDKKVPSGLVYSSDKVETIGSSHGWIATLKDDGILRLQDDLNPYASDTHPRRIPLPPLVTLPHCQTQMVTNVSMSSPDPEGQQCVVAVKFLGPQVSFCRPGLSNSEWTNIRIANPSFYSSRVMFSKKDGMFCIPASGGHLIASWDPHRLNKNPRIQRLRFHNLPHLPTYKRALLDSCCTSEHLVESQSTAETFLLKWYRKTAKPVRGMVKMKTQALMVFRLDQQGNAVYTQDIGDLCIFLSRSEPFCVPASSFPGMTSNLVQLLDFDEIQVVLLQYSSIIGGNTTVGAPYFFPPQPIRY